MYECKMKSMNDAESLKVRSLVTGFDLTAGKVYAVLNEYDSVYELQCDSGIFCRPKDYFVEECGGETN